MSDRSRRWEARNPGAATRMHSDWRKKNPRLLKSAKLKQMYGITIDDYEKLLRKQKGVCAICLHVCKSGRALAVDHDHATGMVRGLLCSNCNKGLGHFQDDRSFLKAASAYLRRWQL